jgi:hypothetical protein
VSCRVQLVDGVERPPHPVGGGVWVVAKFLGYLPRATSATTNPDLIGDEGVGGGSVK